MWSLTDNVKHSWYRPAQVTVTAWYLLRAVRVIARSVSAETNTITTFFPEFLTKASEAVLATCTVFSSYRPAVCAIFIDDTKRDSGNTSCAFASLVGVYFALSELAAILRLCSTGKSDKWHQSEQQDKGTDQIFHPELLKRNEWNRLDVSTISNLSYYKKQPNWWAYANLRLKEVTNGCKYKGSGPFPFTRG